MNPFKINEPVHVHAQCQFICEIVGLIVLSSNTKAVVVIVSSAYQLITSAEIYPNDLC